MAGLSILKHMHNLSDEDLCARWVENPYYQLFCGEEFFRHKPTFDRSSLTRWRQRMGEEKLVALIQESLATATRTGAASRRTSPGSSSTRPCSRRRWRFRLMRN
jgi:transposase, IS5 family